MKYKCKWCLCDIEISQSDKARTGLKKLHDHEAKCFKQRNPNFESLMMKISGIRPAMKRPERDDINGTIEYLDKALGKIPNESQCLRFHMFLESNPSDKECEDFVILLKKMG